MKVYSIVVLIFAGLTFLNLVAELIFGDLNNAQVPEGSPDNVLLITKIVVAVISAIFLVPQTYVGIKGIRVAKNPDSSKAHIIIAITLFAVSVVGLISPIINIFKAESILNNISSLCSILVEAMIFLCYIYYAKEVAKGSK